MKAGTVLKKGNRKRILVGFDGMFVYYKTPSSKNHTTGEIAFAFGKWLKNAEVVSE